MSRSCYAWQLGSGCRQPILTQTRPQWYAHGRTIFVDCEVLPEFSIVLTRQTTMNSRTPHYLLKSETSREESSGRWRFVLRPLDGSPGIEATDMEPDVWGERLDLLTVVRALETLDQPSWVTLVGCTGMSNRASCTDCRMEGERLAMGVFWATDARP